MNDCEETNDKAIKALIVFREISDTDNLFAPILCDAIRMTGIDVQCSKEAFWESDTAYDIIHFQWPEEVVGWNCEDPDVIRRLEERIRFFRSRGAHFVYTRHNVAFAAARTGFGAIMPSALSMAKSKHIVPQLQLYRHIRRRRPSGKAHPRP